MTTADGRKANQESESTTKTLAKPHLARMQQNSLWDPMGTGNIYFETKLVSSLPAPTSPYSKMGASEWSVQDASTKMEAVCPRTLNGDEE